MTVGWAPLPLQPLVPVLPDDPPRATTLDFSLRAKVQEQLRAWQAERLNAAALSSLSSHMYDLLLEAGFNCQASLGCASELNEQESVHVTKIRRKWQHPDTPASFLVDLGMVIDYSPERFGQVTFSVAIQDDHEQLKLFPGLVALLEGKAFHLPLASRQEPADLDFQSWKDRVQACMAALTVKRVGWMLDKLMDHLRSHTSA